MDAHSASFFNLELRHISRTYQDLNACRPGIHNYCKTSLPRQEIMTGTLNKARLHDNCARSHVGVIGAGLAGLRCADVLLQHGFRVTIIEGRNRIGGRVHQCKLPGGHMADLGPNWIHGTAENPIYDIAQQTRTAVKSWSNCPRIYEADGNMISPEEANSLSEKFWGIILEGFQYSNRNCATLDSSKNLHDYFVEKVKVDLPDASQPEKKLYIDRRRKILTQMSETWGFFVGNSVHTQSMKFFWLEECLDGESLFCAGTYQSILDVVSKPAREGSKIMFNTVITRIKTGDGPRRTVKLTTKDGSSLQFDEVVVTAPLGWLKQNLAAFEPELPSRLTAAIQNIGYGCLEKVYITFKRAFWREPWPSGQGMEGFGQWLSPQFASNTNPHQWNQEMVELASLPEGTNHPTLLFYTFGHQSKHITSTLLQLATEEKKNRFIFTLFEPYFSRLPNYSKDDASCQPTGFIHTDWLHDDLAGNGSYSNYQVGLEAGDKDIECMREGVPDRGLWLAGEHTAPFVASGTSTGAYWSGELVAKKIAKRYGREAAKAAVN